MSTAVVTQSIVGAFPRSKARTAGVFYSMTFLAAGVSLFICARLVSGGAALTVTNVLAHERLFLWGIAAELLAIACYVAVTTLFYGWFKPVNSRLSLAAAFFNGALEFYEVDHEKVLAAK